MGTTYTHLDLDERCRLRGLMEMRLGSGEIARRLGRHRATIHREIARNRCADGYRPNSAERRAWARKLRGSKIERSTRLRAHVEDRLAMGWSPEQIAGLMIGAAFFGERLEAVQAAGVVLVLTGILLVQRSAASSWRR